jgi:AcrR family transcriptional regulator
MPLRRGKSPRRKPKQARARDTIELVLDAAARVLGRLGYAAATTNRIAAEAGVGVGTVYEYFSDKDAVFDALIQRELRRLVQAFANQGFESDAPLDFKVRALLAAGMGAMRHGPELFRALEAVPGAVFRSHLAAARRGVIDLIRHLLESHSDEIGVADLDLAAFIVVSAVEGVGANATSRDLDAHLADELTALVMRYLAGPSSSGAARSRPQ